MTTRLETLQVTRPPTRWGAREALSDAAHLVLAVGTLVVAIFLIGAPVALAITIGLWVVRMARGAL